MRRFIPQFLKYPLIAIYILWRILMRGVLTKDMSLNLARVLPPSNSKKIVHGGKVKLLHLRERFGDSWKKFNIAYFVSSGLPFAPKIWLKIYRLFGIKIVWNQNGVAYPAWAGEKTVHINKLMEPIHLADYVFYQTEFTKKCADKYLGKFRGPSSVLVNPIDTRRFKPRSAPLPAVPLVIIMSGHHFESKERLKVSLESIKRLKNVRLLVIGNTQDLPEEDWIEVVGKYTQEEAPELFQRAHIMLHLKSMDPCPTLVLEALASGLPVVGLNNGGMPELVSKDSGILLESKEDFEHFHYPAPEEVAQAVVEISNNLSEYSRAAREQALKFDKEVWLKKHEEIFRSLLS